MGIWSRTFTLTGSRWQLTGNHFHDPYAISLLVFSLLPFIGLIWIWFGARTPHYNGNDSALRKDAFSRLGTSNVLLIIFYFLKSLDILLSQFQLSLKYGYVFTYAFGTPLFQVFADLAILFVACRMYRYIYPVQGKKRRLSGWIQLGVEGLAIPLVALALFQWSLDVAYYTMFLNRTLGWNVILSEYWKLVAALDLLYLIMAGILWINSMVLSFMGFTGDLPSEESHFVGITTVLVARSITLTISHIKYDLQKHTRPDYERSVTAALYGLLSIALYYLITKQSAVQSSSSAEWDVLRDSLQNARKDISRRKADAARGGPPVPAKPEFLGELRAKPLMYFGNDAVESMMAWQDNNKVQSLVEKHTRKVLKLI